MMESVSEVPGWLERGQGLLARGEYAAAREVFAAAVESVTDAAGEGAAAEGLAQAAWELDDGAAVIAARERAYRCYQAVKDPLGAARMAAWLGLDAVHFRSEVAVARGWFGRAHRLLTGRPQGAEHAMLALLEGQVALRVDRDPVKTLDHAAVVIDLGTRLGSVDLEVMGRALRGLALVGVGQVREGMELLDEASAAALSGELEQLSSVWLPCCYLMWGCEQVRDWARAGQWCLRVMQLCRQVDWLGSPYAMCRAHYGAVLLWQGEWAQSEVELQRAADELAVQRPWFAPAALASLGELRRRQGRHAEAAALFERAHRVPAARVGLAEWHLDAGHPGVALEVIERLLDRLEPGTRLERAAALEVAVRAGAAAGDGARWGWAVDELVNLAEAVDTDALRGSAHWAGGVYTMAIGDVPAAIRMLEHAVESFDRAGARYEAARARLELTRAYLAVSRAGPAAEEGRRACQAMAELGAPTEVARARRLLSALPGGAPPHALTARQLEILQLLARGLTNREIATRLMLSEHTVKRHVANILTRLDAPNRAAAATLATRAGWL